MSLSPEDAAGSAAAPRGHGEVDPALPEPAQHEPPGCGLMLLAAVAALVAVAWNKRLDTAMFLVVAELLLAVHEGGHWLVAWLCGIPIRRVVVGLGPPFLVFRVGHAQVSLAALPLWGYVEPYVATAGGYERLSGRRAGGDALDGERDPSCPLSVERYVSGGRRLLFCLGGVAANVALGVVLIWLHGQVDVESRRVLAPLVGTVDPLRPAAAADLREGDRITSVNGALAGGTWSDMVMALVPRPGETPGASVDLGVERWTAAGIATLRVSWRPPPVPEGVRKEGAFACADLLGLGECPSWRVDEVDPTVALLLQPGDEILKARWRDLEVAQSSGDSPFAVYVLFRLAGRAMEKVQVDVARVDGSRASLQVPWQRSRGRRLVGIVLEARIGPVRTDSAAWCAGIRPGDRVLTVDGDAVGGRTDLLERLYQASMRTSHLEVERDGRTVRVDLPAEPRRRGVPTRGMVEGLRATAEPVLDGLRVQAVGDEVRRVLPTLEAGDRLDAPAVREDRLRWVKPDGSHHDAPWQGTAAFWRDESVRVAPFLLDSVREVRPAPGWGGTLRTVGRVLGLMVRSLADLVPSMWNEARRGYQREEAGRMTGRVRARPWSVLFIVALISLFLGVVNAMPLPPLDGARAVLVVLEMVSRRPLQEQAEAGMGCMGRILVWSLSLLGLFLMLRDLVMALFH